MTEKQTSKKLPWNKVSATTIGLFVFLQVAASICTFIILFLQSRPHMIEESYWEKLLANEFWTSVEWAFALPAIKIGFTFLSLPQIILVTYLVGFIVQIFVDKFWIMTPLYLDTFVSMFIMMGAMTIASMKLLG
jgi:hypothetical protein